MVQGSLRTAIGSAVHAVLQTIDLQTGEDLGSAVAAACLAEGVSEHTKLVAALARSALDSDLVKRAAARPHWRESWLATVQADGTVVEGVADLIYRENDGHLVVVDYKTDAIPASAIPARAMHYAGQIRAYQHMLDDAASAASTGRLLFSTRIRVTKRSHEPPPPP